MSPELQQIKIAEACGWEYKTRSVMGYGGLTSAVQYYWSKNESVSDPPDYLNDLNAMHEAKQALWKMDWDYRYIFNDHLANIIKGRIVNRNEWDAETLLDATAEQQAESFLRTLNLWEQ